MVRVCSSHRRNADGAAEALIPDLTIPISGTLLEDLEKLQSTDVLKDDVPAYILTKLDDPPAEWLAIFYVPDTAKVRDKVRECPSLLVPFLILISDAVCIIACAAAPHVRLNNLHRLAIRYRQDRHHSGRIQSPSAEQGCAKAHVSPGEGNGTNQGN